MRATGDTPLIGISASEIRPAQTIRQIQEGEPLSREVALGLEYVSAVIGAGGLAVVLPPAGDCLAGALLDRIEGLCLSGGPDLDPSAYGASPHRCAGPADPTLDRFEIDLAREAVQRDLPLLAVCRGMQVFNVSRGGTLIQHLPDCEWVTIDHRQEKAGNLPSHGVHLDPASRISEVVGENTIAVNTFHHQGIASLGEDLEAVGWDDDGLVEAIEIPDRRFALGVQWHAELMAGHEAGATLFSRLVESAREYRRNHPERVHS
ncbi:MAG TPA: gamma-glutamyl-gamma-aminobutyrate hydrolase family protein [Thermomicrobiales bacterium]|nr:gamma-glutamyl-gamma-aminobutyrate hydrolase family protein [Thermomicrobiales bacterium]